MALAPPQIPPELPVHRILLPTPFPVGPVNAYLLGGRPGEQGMIDCGVRSRRSREALEMGLAAHGTSIAGLTDLLITHPHDDHAGAAVRLSREAGLRIRHHRAGEGRRAARQRAFDATLARYGAPRTLREQLARLNRVGERFGEPLERAPHRAPVADGDRLEVGGMSLQALHTPGHDPAHLCFVAEELGVVFCGDLLLPDITPNPLPHFDPRAPRGRQPTLALFRRSLRRLAALGPLLGLGGHGPPMEDTARIAERSLEAIARRSDAVLALCARHQGATLFALAERLFGEESELGRVLAFTEILAHCDDLEDRGLIEVDHEAGVVVGLT